jgi:PPM family protein phosphatase
MSLNLYAHGNSITGRVRKLNEDSFSYNFSKGIYGSLFVVCDGMGGHKAGEIASKYGSKKIYQYFIKSSTGSITARLKESIKRINDDIYQASQKDSSKKGMGTTLVAAYIFDNKLYIANVGDSRAYIVRNSTIKRLTVDHSWVEEKIKEGAFTRAEAKVHPKKNVITRCIGYDFDVEVDTYIYDLMEGDRILLCTDGLWDELNDPEIKRILSESRNIKDATTNLAKEANLKGGRDNITCVGIDYGQFKHSVIADKKVYAIIALSSVCLILVLTVMYLLIKPVIKLDKQNELAESAIVSDLDNKSGEIVEEVDAEEFIDLNAEDAKEKIDNTPGIIIIDVSQEYSEYIPGAVNYPIGDSSLNDAIPGFDPNWVFLVYGRSDEESERGAQKLVDAGFKDVYRLEGNFKAWKDAGYQFERVVEMSIVSTSFLNNENIPEQHACDKENISPGFTFSGIPTGTASLLLIMEDPDKDGGIFTHWVVYNIDPNIGRIPEGNLPSGVEIIPFLGPCNHPIVHHYHFRLYALDKKLDSEKIKTVNDVEDEIKGFILAEAELIGLYGPTD